MFDVIAALILGFQYGLGPCTLSCAPLVVPLIMASAKGKKDGIVKSIIFSLGRVGAYILLGFISGLLGANINAFIPKWALGLFFIIAGLALMFKVTGKCILKTGIRITGNFMALIAGFLYGLGPCPPLLALLGLAVASKSAIIGGLMGLVFGIGTTISPIIILGLLSGWFSNQKEFKEVIPYVTGGFLIIVGIFYIVSAF